MQQAEASLTKMNFCSCVHTKEMYLQRAVIDGKHIFHASSNKCYYFQCKGTEYISDFAY